MLVSRENENDRKIRKWEMFNLELSVNRKVVLAVGISEGSSREGSSQFKECENDFRGLFLSVV